jgi:hypothetical protein
MSLSETREIMSVLQEIMALLNNVEFKTKVINEDLPKTQKAFSVFRQLEQVILRYLVLARKMGLPNDINQAISSVAKLIVVVRMLQMTISMAAKGPLGLIGAIGSVGITAISVGEMTSEYMNGVQGS